MKEDKIVELVREGFLEKYIEVYTPAGRFIGTWYAVDLSTKTIEIKKKMKSILLILLKSFQFHVLEKEHSLDDFVES